MTYAREQETAIQVPAPFEYERATSVEHAVGRLDRLGDSARSTVAPTQIRIGAVTRHRELLESGALAASFPIFRDAERVIADPRRATGGRSGASAW